MSFPYPSYVPSFDPPEPDYLRWDEPQPDEENPEAEYWRNAELDRIAFGPWATAGELMRF